MNEIIERKNLPAIDIIDQDLQKESVILEELIQNVIISNQKIKSTYLDYFETKTKKLVDLTHKSELTHQEILNSESTKEKQRLNSFVISQKQIFEKNSNYRFKLIEDSIKKTTQDQLFIHIDRFHILQDHLAHLMNGIQRNIFDISLQQISANHQYLDEETKIHFDAIHSKLEPLFEEKKNSIEIGYQSLIAEYEHVISMDETSNELKSYTDQVESYVKKLKDIYQEYEEKSIQNDNHIQNILHSSNNEANLKTDAYRNHLLEKYASTIENEKNEVIALTTEIDSLKLDIDHYLHLNQKTMKLNHRLKIATHSLNKKRINWIDEKSQKYHQLILKRIVKANTKLLRQHHGIYFTLYRDQVNSIENLLVEMAKAQHLLSNRLFQNMVALVDKIHKLSTKLLSEHNDVWANLNRSKFLINAFTTQLSSRFQKVIQLFDFSNNKTEHFRKSLQQYLLQEQSKLHERLSDFSKLYANEIEIYNQTLIHTQNALNEMSVHFNMRTQSEIESLRLKEQLQVTIIENQLLIENAEREFQIQAEKAQLIFDHEKSISNVQNHRIDSSTEVTKSMIKAMIQRQTNFADQQIQFAEEEYKARIEHSKTMYEQELDYLDQRIKEISLFYEQKIVQLENVFNYNLETLISRKSLFNEPKYVKKIESEINQIKSAHQSKVESIKNEMRNDDQLIKYSIQHEEIKKQLQKIVDDALLIRDQDISKFIALKQESEQRIQSLERTVGSMKLIDYVESEIYQNSNRRLQETLDAAERIRLSKIKIPTEKLNEFNRKLQNIKDSFDDDFSYSKLHQEKQIELTTLIEEQNIQFSNLSGILNKQQDFKTNITNNEYMHKRQIISDNLNLPKGTMHPFQRGIKKVSLNQLKIIKKSYVDHKSKLKKVEKTDAHDDVAHEFKKLSKKMVRKYRKNNVFSIESMFQKIKYDDYKD